ncbi:MAG: hypothetical protein MK111_22265, partial [Crocosphaera sp.]|uniref:hypothetical protein n=1 Tax=Crocosphaera sp. TaxID=2729996 RepID=UPI00258794E3
MSSTKPKIVLNASLVDSVSDTSWAYCSIKLSLFDEEFSDISKDTNPEFLTKSAIAKHRSLTGSGFEQS